MRRFRAWFNWKKRLAVWLGLLVLAAGLVAWMVVMPGKSHRGELAALTADEQTLATELEGHVRELAETIGPRNNHTLAAEQGKTSDLDRAAAYIEERLPGPVRRQSYKTGGREYANLEARVGSGPAVVIVGAHYDSYPGTPGADDNASGVAALLALAARVKDPGCELRFVAFTNEEPYFFQTEEMGSLVYARECRSKNEPVQAMLSLETMGYYDERAESQHYPFPLGLLYPDRGDFVAFVGNLRSRELVHRSVESFRRQVRFPCEGAALPSRLPGVGWSDHWSFWQVGYPALMVTDTAPFRNPHYHQMEDTPDKLDYARMARVVAGLELVLRELCKTSNRASVSR